MLLLKKLYKFPSVLRFELIVITKSSILDVAVVLDPPLESPADIYLSTIETLQKDGKYVQS